MRYGTKHSTTNLLTKMWYDHARRYVRPDLVIWLQRRIEKTGLSCLATAADIGISLSSLLFLMKGRSRPKPDPVQKIATYFHADLFYVCELAG